MFTVTSKIYFVLVVTLLICFLCLFRAKHIDAALRAIFKQVNIVLETFNATIRLELHSRYGYDGFNSLNIYFCFPNRNRFQRQGFGLAHTDRWSMIMLTSQSFRFLCRPNVRFYLSFIVTKKHRNDIISGLELIDYVDTIAPFRGYFIFRFPNLSTVKNIYVLPFSRVVWLCLGACAIVCIITTFFIMRSEASLVKDTQKRSVMDVSFMICSIICQMGSELEARLASTRIFIFFSFVTFIFVYTSYTANIVALLQTPTKSIQTLEDLYNSKLELGVEDNLYNRYYIGVSFKRDALL